MPTFTILLKQAWSLYQRNFWQIVLFYLALLGVAIGVLAVLGALAALVSRPVILVALVMIVLLSLVGFSIGSFQSLIVAIVKKSDASVKTVFSRGWQVMFAVATLFILLMFIYALGFALLVIPGLIMVTLLSFSLIEAVIEETTAIGAVKASFALAKRASWHVAQLTFAGLLLTSLFAIAPGGMLISFLLVYPIWFIATLLQYQKIRTLTRPINAPAPLVISVIVLVLAWFGVASYEIKTNRASFESFEKATDTTPFGQEFNSLFNELKEN